MQLENSFVVAAPPDRVWRLLLDVERVASCLPGAELLGSVDDHTWKGKVEVKIGPVSLSFSGTLVREEVAEEQRRVVLRAKGTETRGKGTASALVTSRVDSANGGTRVAILTDLKISGAAAQYGRGLIADISERFTGEFAKCLARKLAGSDAAGEGAAAEAPAGAARPIAGGRLALWALFRAASRSVGRVWRALTFRRRT